MSRPLQANTDTHGVSAGKVPEPVMTRLVCFLRPGEYTNRFERQLARQSVVILRPRHEMHAFWTILTTRPHALITDMPLTSLSRSYLVNRLAMNPKTAAMPIIVLGTNEAQVNLRELQLPPSVRLMEVTTPTRMAELVLETLKTRNESIADGTGRQWRTDVAVGGGASVVPNRRSHHESASSESMIDKHLALSGQELAANTPRPIGLALPRRRVTAATAPMPAVLPPTPAIVVDAHSVPEVIKPRRVQSRPAY